MLQPTATSQRRKSSRDIGGALRALAMAVALSLVTFFSHLPKGLSPATTSFNSRS